MYSNRIIRSLEEEGWGGIGGSCLDGILTK